MQEDIGKTPTGGVLPNVVIFHRPRSGVTMSIYDWPSREEGRGPSCTMGMFETLTRPGQETRLMLNVALSAGSSKQGKVVRALMG
jgi:hypothetical protein